MAQKWDGFLGNRDDSSTDPEQDFESFLRKKVQECTQDVPTSQLSTTGPDHKQSGTSQSQSNANTVAETSEPTTSPVTHEENPLSEQSPASVVDEKVTRLELRDHPIAGRHLVEHAATVGDTLRDKPFESGLTVDAEWVRIRNESYTFAIVELNSCEEVIERIHDLNRLRFLIPAKESGLRNALEELLKSRNAEDRAVLTALMSENYRKIKSRAAGTTAKPRTSITKDKKVGSGAMAAAVGKGQKLVRSFMIMGMDKDWIIARVKEQKLWNDAVSAFLDKMIAEAK